MVVSLYNRSNVHTGKHYPLLDQFTWYEKAGEFFNLSIILKTFPQIFPISQITDKVFHSYGSSAE